jgi:hypothetical protein
MSSVALSGSVVGSPSTRQSTSSAVSKGRYAKIALATTLAATLANAVVYFLADLFVRYHPDFLILQDVSATVITTSVAGVVASLLYAGLLRFTANPGVEGASTAQAAVLVLMHVVAATIITGMLTKLARPARS